MTAAGATAYARFYNRRLPTFEEWLYAVGKGEKAEVPSITEEMESNEMQDMEKMHAKMLESEKKSEAPALENQAKRLFSVSDYKENKYGVRAMDRDFGEWSLVRKSILTEEPLNPADYMIMPTGVRRQPWEAFEEVGFRCARDIKKSITQTK